MYQDSSNVHFQNQPGELKVMSGGIQDVLKVLKGTRPVNIIDYVPTGIHVR